VSASGVSGRDPLPTGEKITVGLMWLLAASAAALTIIKHGQTRQISDVIAGVAILTGFLFAQLLFIFQLRMRITDSSTIPNYGALRRLINASFGRAELAVLSALATTVTAVLANAFSRKTVAGVDSYPGRWWTAALLFLGVQTVWLMLMTVWDLHRAYRQMPG
jgi:hypothetical protein